MDGIRNTKELPVYLEWVLADNYQLCDRYYEFLNGKKEKATGRKSRIKALFSRRSKTSAPLKQLKLDT